MIQCTYTFRTFIVKVARIKLQTRGDDYDGSSSIISINITFCTGR